MDERFYISVILPLKLEWEPCYWTVQEVVIGDRVKVKFANKLYVGVVSRINIKPELDTNKINGIISIEKEIGRVFIEEIELWRRVAEYYLCTIGEVYKVAYPAGKINLEQSRAEAKKKVCKVRERKLEIINEKLEKLQARLAKKTAQEEKAKDKTKIKAKLQAEITKIKEEIAIGEYAREVASKSLESAKIGLLLKTDYPLEDTITLSQAQQKAYDEILDGFTSGKPVLLYGITGSGKTEIYIKLAQKCISEHKNILYMVPEIALSRQLEERLRKHFSDRLIVFHSGESAATRRNAAEMIRHIGDKASNYIVLSTRSGLFLPHQDLGLIIIDEEHDSSYKQDSPAPRYNGRDTAVILSLIHKCSIVLGSATPSLESLYNISAGKYCKVNLTERYYDTADAEIEIIDTRAEWRKHGMVGNFSRKLIDEIKERLHHNEQVLILRSRRAWSTALQCESCGEIQKCPHCNVSLSYHKANGRMVCHYCGYNGSYDGRCSKCSGPVKHLGTGTQKIEEEAATLFPDATIARLDSDTSQQKSYERKVIKDFTDGKIDILIGTQMITKGFDFENLSLVVIIAADTLLGIQDFRADEKALQTIEQFKGRCGRRSKAGKLIIQTSQPDHPIYRQLTGCSEISHNDLMTERKEFDFPPYSRIVEITFKDIFEDRAERMVNKFVIDINNLVTSITGYSTTPFSITGPYRPAVDKQLDQHIRKVRISLRKDKQLGANKKLLKECIAQFEKRNRYDGHITIDVDPS